MEISESTSYRVNLCDMNFSKVHGSRYWFFESPFSRVEMIHTYYKEYYVLEIYVHFLWILNPKPYLYVVWGI